MWSATGRALPSNWRSIAARVKSRDGHRCTWQQADGTRCSETTRLEVDHIGSPNDHTLRNLRTLCHWHHAKRTALQAASARRVESRARVPESHPGLT